MAKRRSDNLQHSKLAKVTNHPYSKSCRDLTHWGFSGKAPIQNDPSAPARTKILNWSQRWKFRALKKGIGFLPVSRLTTWNGCMLQTFVMAEILKNPAVAQFQGSTSLIWAPSFPADMIRQPAWIYSRTMKKNIYCNCIFLCVPWCALLTYEKDIMEENTNRLHASACCWHLRKGCQ